MKTYRRNFLKKCALAGSAPVSLKAEEKKTECSVRRLKLHINLK